MDRDLTYDHPQTAGERNVLLRARRLLELRWEPLRACALNPKNYIAPLRGKRVAETPESFTGVPYSSCRTEDRFVGLDISVETFETALANPDSILYTRDLSDFDDPAYNCAIGNTYFVCGIVCSSFVNYCLDLPLHRCTREWDIAPEFLRLSRQCADALKLCDTLVTTRPNGRTGGHVRIVTGLARDAAGAVKRIQISEGIPPLPVSRWYSAEEFESSLTDPGLRYQIFRYRFLNRVTWEPVESGISAHQSRGILPDRGNASNYRAGETVKLYVPDQAEQLLLKSGSGSGIIPVSGKKALLTDLKPGIYTVSAPEDGDDLEPAVFCVTEPPEITVVQDDGSAFPMVRLKPVAPDGSQLTEDSACFYDDAGRLKTGTVDIALTDGKRLYPARAALRERKGGLFVRTAAFLWNEALAPSNGFYVGADTALFAFAARENTPCRIRFPGGKQAEPIFLSWKEEAAIAYEQRLFTPEEAEAREARSRILYHDNPFARVTVFSRNRFGRFASDYLPFLVLREEEPAPEQ